MDIAYFKEGQSIAKEGDKAERFFVVAKGVVCENSTQRGESFHLAKDFFDFESALSGVYKASFDCAEEALLYCVDANVLLDVVRKSPILESYFLLSAAKKLEQKAKTIESYLIRRVNEIDFAKPLFVSPDISIFDAVTAMCADKKTFALIRFEDNILGVVTDSDLRKRVILNRLNLDSPIGAVATRSPICIDEKDFLFNALLLMTRHNIKRLIVTNGKEIAGVLEEINILAAFSMQTQFISRRIEQSDSVEELKKAMADIDNAIVSLLLEGVKVKHISRLVAELNSKIFKKAFDFAIPAEIAQNCCFVVMGSEGRGEQILRTDQDNALIVRDGFEHPMLRDSCLELSAILIELGFPECDGGVMVRNPDYSKSLTAFKEEIFTLINTPVPQSFLKLPILMDMSTVAGDDSLRAGLIDYLRRHLGDSASFLAHIANGALAFETPLGLFHTFSLDKKEHAGELDLKKGGIFAVVHGVRCLAYENSIGTTSSFERIKQLANMGKLDKELSEELIEAYNFLLEIRLKERIRKIKMGQQPDNFIAPSKLSKLERDLLKDVLKIVDKFKKFLFAHFKLGFIG